MQFLGELYQSQPLIMLSMVAVFALMVGSFLNVVIYRLPIIMEREWRIQCQDFLGHPDTEKLPVERYNLVVPRSRCPHCDHLISAWENIPVISYLFQKGRCRHCSKPISMRYPVIEALTAVLSVMVINHFGLNWSAISLLILTWGLISLSFIDFDHHLLPDNLTLPLMWLGLLMAVFGIGAVDVKSAVVGTMIGYASLWTIFQLFRLATGKEGMGYGDFKLLAVFGAWLGWQQLPLIILLASFVGAVVGILNIVIRKKDKSQPIPFGPFLCTAGFIAMLWGDQITRNYMQLMHIRF
jgi:leader peptidase (prepilin peptidase)/N-methyltransferase